MVEHKSIISKITVTYGCGIFKDLNVFFQYGVFFLESFNNLSGKITSQTTLNHGHLIFAMVPQTASAKVSCVSQNYRTCLVRDKSCYAQMFANKRSNVNGLNPGVPVVCRV